MSNLRRQKNPRLRGNAVKPRLLALAMTLAFLAGCAQFKNAPVQATFGEGELRAAEKELERALESPDPTAWVYHYTEDAVFVGPGGPAVQGRAALLDMAKAMHRLSSVVITPLRTETSGRVASVYARASWVTGAQTSAPTTTNVRGIMVWRKESDGRWRVAQELLHAEPVTK
jgi:ketosteroid isomerase-like protein